MTPNDAMTAFAPRPPVSPPAPPPGRGAPDPVARETERRRRRDARLILARISDAAPALQAALPRGDDAPVEAFASLVAAVSYLAGVFEEDGEP